MKLKVLFTTIAIIIFGLANGQVEKPVRAKVIKSTPDIMAFYKSAIKLKSQEVRTINELKTKENRARIPAHKRHYSWANIVLKRGYALAADVKNTKGNISRTQYLNFQTKLKEIELELDKIAGSGTSATSNPAPGTLGECWKSCNDAVGPGFGQGKGFDRFGCKAGCIITKLPPGK